MSEQYDPNWVHNLRGLLAGKASFTDIMKLRLLTCFNELYASRTWQPIETAPKDGTEILVFGYARCDGSRYANGQHVAWWDGELGWCGRDPDDRVTLHPSHWQPLPEPPTNALRQGRKETGE